MRTVSSLVRRWRILLAVAIGLVFLPASPAQEQLGDTRTLSRAFDTNALRRNDLFDGREQAAKDDEKIADAAAKWLIYRVTHRTLDMDRVQKEFNSVIATATDKNSMTKNRAFIAMFATSSIACMKDVLALDIKTYPNSVINGAMMLPGLARLKQDKVTEYLVQLIEDKATPEPVRLYAIKSLRETIAVVPQVEEVDVTDTAYVARKKREVKQVTALTKYVEQPMDVKGMNPQEVAAAYFLRREAIVSLAGAGSPAVLALPKKPKTLEGPVAPTLLKVLSNDMTPPPSLQEKLEAALGVCAMKYPHMEEYQPDAGIHGVAQTLVEFTNAYNKDWVNFTAPAPRKKLPYLPWKGYASRLTPALRELALNAKGSPTAKKNAEVLETAAKDILKSIAGYSRPEPAQVQRLAQLAASLQPKNAAPFKTLK